MTALDSAISRAQAFLLGAQAADGHWVGQLEANTTITSEYMLLCHLIDRVSKERERKARADGERLERERTEKEEQARKAKQAEDTRRAAEANPPRPSEVLRASALNLALG